MSRDRWYGQRKDRRYPAGPIIAVAPRDYEVRPRKQSQSAGPLTDEGVRAIREAIRQRWAEEASRSSAEGDRR